MRLAFYSDQLLDDRRVDERLLALFSGSNPVLGYIPSCSDPERQFFSQRRQYYKRYGINLKVYFELDHNYQHEILDDLLLCDGIHLSGGNTFYFLYWLRKRKLLSALRDYATMGGVLIGVSAGAMILTADIATAYLCGDTNQVGISNLSALGLAEFEFLPHFNNLEFPESVLIEHSRQTQRSVFGCKDGEGIIVDNGDVHLVGEIVSAVDGHINGRRER